MEYLMDNQRHLICLPYSIENLHLMASDLGIKKHWYHPGNYPHYDIPKRMIADLKTKCTLISSKELLLIIKENL